MAHNTGGFSGGGGGMGRGKGSHQTPTDTAVASVTTNPTSVTAEPGQTFQINASALNAAGQALGGKSFTAVSSDPSTVVVQSISGNIITGKLLSPPAAPVTLTIASGGHQAVVPVTSSIIITSLTLSPTSVTVVSGSTSSASVVARNRFGVSVPVPQLSGFTTDNTIASISSIIGSIVNIVSNGPGSASIHVALAAISSNPVAVTATQPPVTLVPTSYRLTLSATPVPANTPVTVTAQLLDQNGGNFAGAGQAVTWGRTQGSGNGGSFASQASTTNGSGVATVVFTTGAGESYQITGTDFAGRTGTSPVLVANPAGGGGGGGGPVLPEPAFGDDPSDSLLIAEPFNYATFADFVAQQLLPGLHMNTNGDGQLVAGPGGVGKALRLTYTNAGPGQEIHKVDIARDGHVFSDDALGSISDLTHGKTVIVQDERRLIGAVGLGIYDDIAMKWMEFVYGNPATNDGDANLRQLFQTANHGTYPTVWDCGALFQTIGTHETFNDAGQTMDGKQDIPHPVPFDLMPGELWFTETFMYRPNTSPAQKDGFARMWVNGVMLFNVSQATVGVIRDGAVGDGTPTGKRPMCIQADVDNIGLKSDGTGYNPAVATLVWYHQLLSYTGNNFNGGPGGFTADTANIKIWVRN